MGAQGKGGGKKGAGAGGGGGKQTGQASILSFFRAPTPASAGAASAPAGSAAACEKQPPPQEQQEQQEQEEQQQEEKAGRKRKPPRSSPAPSPKGGDGEAEPQEQAPGVAGVVMAEPEPEPEPMEEQPQEEDEKDGSLAAAAGAAAGGGGDGAPEPPSPAAAPPQPEQGEGGPPASTTVDSEAVVAAADAEAMEDDEEEDERDGLTDFERARLERIKENQAFLASLGLQACKPSALMGDDPNKKKKGKPKKKRPAPTSSAAAASVPVRRSTRQRGPPLSSYSEIEAAAAAAAAAAAMEEEEAEPEEEVDYDDSSVLRYLCCGSADGEGGKGSIPQWATAAGATGGSKRSSGPLKGFRASSSSSSQQQLGDPSLSAVYSLRLQPVVASAGAAPLLAAAGKQGRIAIFNTGTAAAAPPPPAAAAAAAAAKSGDVDDGGLLLSYRGHGGWVADVRFLSSSSTSPLLASAGNDASIKLWDLSRVHPTTGVPKAVASLDHVHSKGVFSMDASGPLIATGSKDATVALLRLFPDGRLTEDRRLEDLQDSVIKCVRFAHSSSSAASPDRLALAGDDRDVRVVDLRSDTQGDGLRIPQAHARTVHTLRWHPTEEHLLLTVGLDPYVRLWDLRKLPSSSSSSSSAAAVDPLVAFFGHVSSLVRKQAGITPAEFYDQGKYVLIAGEGSQRLSVYDTATGHAVSRGMLGADISQIAVLESGLGPDPDYRPSLLVAERKGAIGRLDPF